MTVTNSVRGPVDVLFTSNSSYLQIHLLNECTLRLLPKTTLLTGGVFRVSKTSHACQITDMLKYSQNQDHVLGG